ncbi:hypothetical protein BCR35DRAFT_134429 [Leucosporidium creatinivorum]|uniref:CCHC-type domain-containing protein n=1 Tax=Leucosporidium creatinivorum TaxID=106004 RepID=A0A1Y2G0L7_9BASI|nr:hypothetical protein BCR35DRAFT_134429 [Leucosporidium creatinivorum]
MDPTPSTSRAPSVSAVEPARPAPTKKKSKPASAIPPHLMAGQKRPVEESPEAKSKRTKKPRSDKPKWTKAEKKARKAAVAAGETGISIKGTASKSTSEDDDSKEEGEIQGDFNDLFFMDSTPSVIPAETAYVESAQDSPVKAGAVEGETKMEEKARLLAQEEEDMRIFANEVAMTESEDDDSDDDEEDEEDDGPRPLPYAEDMLYEDEEALQEAIRGKIIDDSAAKVTGRYYKEADLTKSCALCGEQGHSSRDCQHSQCFICGLVDSDHEARNCPVALVCSACGSRGHFARDCTNATPMRGSHYGARCTHCSSNNHLTVNCPTLWRVYDTTGAKPAKRKIVFACANDGTTRDHFADDW